MLKKGNLKPGWWRSIPFKTQLMAFYPLFSPFRFQSRPQFINTKHLHTRCRKINILKKDRLAPTDISIPDSKVFWLKAFHALPTLKERQPGGVQSFQGVGKTLLPEGTVSTTANRKHGAKVSGGSRRISYRGLISEQHQENEQWCFNSGAHLQGPNNRCSH